MNRAFSRHLLAAAAAILLLATSASSATADNLELIDWVDADAALVVGTRVSAFEHLAGAIRPYADEGDWRRVTGELSQVLGFDPTTSAGWAQAGVAPEGTALISLMAVDPAQVKKAAERAIREMKKKKRPIKAVKAPFYRSRFVVSLTDADTARKNISALAGKSKQMVAVSDPTAAKWLAQAMGVKAAEARRTLGQLKKAGVFVIAGMPKRGLGFARTVRGKKLLVVDMLTPSLDLPNVWGGLSGAVVAAVRGGAKKSSVRKEVTAAKAAIVGDSDAWFYLRPQQLVDAFQVRGYRYTVRALESFDDRAKLDEIAKEGFSEVAMCDQMRPFASKGAFEGYAASATIKQGELLLRGGWTLRSGTGFADQLKAAPNREEPHGENALMRAAWYFNPAVAGAVLPRPKLFKGQPQDVAQPLQACGPAGFIVLGLFGWPQAFAAAADGWVPPPADTVLKSMHGGFVALRDADDRFSDVSGLFGLSFEKDADAAAVTQLMGSMLGGEIDWTYRGQKIKIWSPGGKGQGPFGFRFRRGDVTSTGGAIGSGILAWHLRGGDRFAHGDKNSLARFTIDIGAFARKAAKNEPDLQRFASVGVVSGVFEVVSNTLRGSLRVPLKK